MMHKTCPINYGHLADLQKALPTIDLNKKNFHLIKYLLATFVFVLSFQSVLVYFVLRDSIHKVSKYITQIWKFVSWLRLFVHILYVLDIHISKHI